MNSQENTPFFPGSRVLVSQGAENFDPDSFLAESVKEEIVAPDPPISNQKTLVVLRFAPPLGEQVQVAGILSFLSTKPSGITVEFVCLAELAMELVQLSIGTDPTVLESIDLVSISGKEVPKLILPNLLLSKVRVRNLGDNRAEVKVQVRYP